MVAPTNPKPYRMINFASQCLDQTKALLKLNLGSLAPDGSVIPVPGEVSRADEPGHAALAFGEYYRATGELSLDRTNIVEIVARTITAQVRLSKGSDNGMAFACLGLLAFGPTRERNPVWEKLDEATRQLIDERLAIALDDSGHDRMLRHVRLHEAAALREGAPGAASHLVQKLERSLACAGVCPLGQA